jgi:hypothetical protein
MSQPLVSPKGSNMEFVRISVDESKREQALRERLADF